MRRLGLGIILLLAILTACIAPAVEPTAERVGATVVITLEPTVSLYSVTLSVLNATSSDERCVVINEIDVGCVLGDLPEGSSTTVTVFGSEGAVQCSAFGFTDPNLAISTYRAYPCN